MGVGAGQVVPAGGQPWVLGRCRTASGIEKTGLRPKKGGPAPGATSKLPSWICWTDQADQRQTTGLDRLCASLEQQVYGIRGQGEVRDGTVKSRHPL